MGKTGRVWVTLLAVLLCTIGLRAQQAAAGAAGLPTLTRIEQIRQLTRDQANRGYPVHLRAVVTYYAAQGSNVVPQETYPAVPGPDMFIQDSTAGIWVDAPAGGPQAKQGQLIEIEGVSEGPDFAPQIGKPRWEVIGQAAMPHPRHPTFDRMASTLEDSQWVEIEGIVRSAEEQDGFLNLNVAMSGGRVRVLIPRLLTPIPDWLADSEVRIRGACGALFNQKSQLIGVLLYVPSWDEVRVVKPASVDPFNIGAEPLIAVQRFSPAAVSGHRIHVRGVVTLQQLGSSLYISDGRVGLRVETRQHTALLAGDRVDVVGFPHLSDFRPVLEDATFRFIGKGPQLTPIPVTAKQLLEGDYDSELVSVDADLLEKSLLPGSQALILQSSSVTFSASISAAGPDNKLESLHPGSRLRVAGVCLAQKDEDGTNQSFRILFDGSDDIAIVRQPSWWTARHAFQALVWIGLVALAALAWIFVQRQKGKQALEQERNLLRTLIDNTPDFIYVKDTANRFLVANTALARRMGAGSAVDLLGKTDLDYYPEELATKFISDEQEIMRSGRPVINREDSVQDASGNTVWHLTTEMPFRDVADGVAFDYRNALPRCGGRRCGTRGHRSCHHGAEAGRASAS